MLLCFRGLASEEIEKLSLNSIPDLMKGVVEDRNAIIGNSDDRELEIRKIVPILMERNQY